MSRWETFRQLRQALAERRLGDVALLKSELSGGVFRNRALTERLLRLGEFPDVDPEPLRTLPRGTLGREYIELLDANGLVPFRISDRLDRAIVERNIFIARYSLVHDVFHVLTGFDTSWAGELGVWAFLAAQRYARAHWIAVAVACLLYPLLNPLRIPQIIGNLRRGIAMGRRARPLLFVPFDRLWTRPVAELRRDLCIDATDDLAALITTPTT